MRPYIAARWIVVVLFGLGCIATLNYNGPFFDESIYITAGLRALEGYGISDGYLTWFGGTLLWPILAGLGWQAAGVLGTRAIAVLLGTVALAAVGRAASNLFDEAVGFWTALAMALNGPLVSLARLGVYDVAALAGIAISFWAVTEMVRQNHRRWLIVSAVSWAGAVLAKYPIGLMALPLLALVCIQRPKRWSTDVAIFIFVAGAVGLALFVPLREQIAGFFSWRLENRPGFGVSLRVIAFAIAYLSAAPVVLGTAGWVLSRPPRWLATALLGSALIWPAYHLLLADPVGTNKHLVFGFLFVYPLVGVALAKLWALRPRLPLNKLAVGAIVAGLALAGYIQVRQGDQAWPDLATPAFLLVQEVKPGDTLLINEAWPFTLELYARGRLASPWDVYNEYRMLNETTAPTACDYDWVVDTQGSYSWGPEVREALSACDTYEAVAVHASTVVNLGRDLNYVSYPVQTTIWRNVAEAR